MRRRRCGPNRRHPTRQATKAPYALAAYKAVFTTKPGHTGRTGNIPPSSGTVPLLSTREAGGYSAGTGIVHVTLRCSCSKLRIGTPMRTRDADTWRSGATLTLASPSAVTTARIKCVVASTRKSVISPLLHRAGARPRRSPASAASRCSRKPPRPPRSRACGSGR